MVPIASLDLNIGCFPGFFSRLDETGQTLEGRGVDGTTAGGFHHGWMDGWIEGVDRDSGWRGG